jgi:ferredoxin-NADP reductase
VTTWTTARVVSATDAADGIRSLRLAFGRPVQAPPGSHLDVMVHLRGRTETRSYSVVANGAREGTVDLAVRLAHDGGGGSRYMHGLTVGDRLRVTEPVQDFPLTRGRPGYVLVAGGIGITPLLPMYRHLRAEGAAVRLVFAGRDRRSMAFLDELADGPVELVVEEEGGLIDGGTLVAGLPEDHDIYVCGPIGLLEALRTAWRAAGRPGHRFRFETFGSSGRHPAEEFVVEVPRLSLRTRVPTNQSLLDALRAAGVEMMYDCRRGECGLCEVRVLGADGVVDHRDVFLSDAQHAEGGYLCACVSRVASAPGTASPPRLILDLPGSARTPTGSP